MKMIYLNRDGQKVGPFTEQEMRQQVSTGQVAGAELAWQPGVDQWLPVSQILAPPASERPTLELGTLIRKSWPPFLEHFVLLVVVAAVVEAPDFLIEIAGLDAKTLFSARGLAQWLIQPTAGAVASAFTGVSIYAVFQRLNGRGVSPREAVQRGLQRYVPLCLLYAVFNLATAIAAMALVVPAIVFLVVFLVCDAVCMIEGADVVESLRRSAQLTRGHRGKLALLVVAYLVLLLLLRYAVDDALEWSSLLKFGISVMATAYQAALTTTAYVELRRLELQRPAQS